MGIGYSQLQEYETKHDKYNKNLNVFNTNNCLTINSSGKLDIDNCNDKNLFDFYYGELHYDNQCIDEDLKLSPCYRNKQLWVYDSKTGFVKNIITNKCISVDSSTCTPFNYGKVHTFTQKDRNNLCGKNNLLPLKLNYLQDLGNCDPNYVCSPQGVCKNAHNNKLYYTPEYTYLYDKGVYDGLKTFTEIDRRSKCGPDFLIPNTYGYLPDSGKCDPGRYCNDFGSCTNVPKPSNSINNKYNGEKLPKIDKYVSTI